MPAFQPFSGILFDHDGVLVASEPLHWAAWKGLFQEIKIPFDEPLIRKLVGFTSPEILSAVLNKYAPGWENESNLISNFAASARIQAQTLTSEQLLTKLSHRKNDLYIHLAHQGLQPYPGVLECIQKLHKRGIKMGVVSNARTRELELSLAKTGLAPYFQAVVSRESGVPAKPAPDPYKLGAALLELNPEDCLAFEDSPPGLQAALLAKTQAYGVLTNFEPAALERPVPGRPDLRPLALFQDLGEALVQILK